MAMTAAQSVNGIASSQAFLDAARESAPDPMKVVPIRRINRKDALRWMGIFTEAEIDGESFDAHALVFMKLIEICRRWRRLWATGSWAMPVPTYNTALKVLRLELEILNEMEEASGSEYRWAIEWEKSKAWTYRSKG